MRWRYAVSADDAQVCARITHGFPSGVLVCVGGTIVFADDALISAGCAVVSGSGTRISASDASIYGYSKGSFTGAQHLFHSGMLVLGRNCVCLR